MIEASISEIQENEWTKLLGTSSFDSGSSLVESDDGSIYITGSTKGDLDGQVNNGNSDIFLSKFNRDGSQVWTQLVGTQQSESGRGIAVDKDGSIYLTGGTSGNLNGYPVNGSSDIFITKYTSDGLNVWTQLLGTSSTEYATSVSIDDESVYIAGVTLGNLDGQTHKGRGDAFISKFSKDGIKQWTKTLGTSSQDHASSISTAADGSIYVAGYTTGDLDGEIRSGYGDAFLSKFSSDGSKQWTQLLGTISHNAEMAYAVKSANDGSIYITGRTYGDLGGQARYGYEDIFIAKYTSDGLRDWTQLLGTSLDDSPRSIATSEDGSIFITGYTNGDLNGQRNNGPSDTSDIFVIKLDSNGSRRWTHLLGTTSRDVAHSLIVSPDGPIYITGTTYGDLGDQSNNGDADAFLYKFIPKNTPTDLILSSNLIDEIIEASSVVASLMSIDDDLGDAFDYALVNGEGDADNNAFAIDGDQLKIVQSPDFETKSTYSIRLQTKDSAGLTLEKAFVLIVNDINEAPSALTVSESGFDEHIAGGVVVASLGSADVDASDTFTYALVSGDGDTDNSAFVVDGDQLKIVDSPDFETKSSYSIRLQTRDSGGLTFNKAFTLSVNDLEEVPVIQSIDDVSTQKKVTTFKIQDPVAFEGQEVDTVIVGTKKKDKITGTSEGEVLAGMKGKDVLKGGGGADGFLFNQPGSFGNKQVDQIKDFDSDEGDSILLVNGIFGLGKKIKLKSYGSKNKVKKAAKSKNDFIYDEKKGLLYFNENGKQKGWGDGGLFAKLQGAPELGADNFTIV